jgi:hypothetical protein
VLAAAAPAAAARAVTWQVVAHGAATSGGASKPSAVVAATRAAAQTIAARVPASARKKAFGVDYRRYVLVGVFGPFGCKDGRVHVERIAQNGRALVVHLATSPPAPGTVECQAIFPTFRLLVVPRSGLTRTPDRASVSVAPA